MEQGNKQNGIYSKVIRAGRRRTYFFDIRATKGNEYYLTITESKKRFDSDGYERHKIHIYKEDLNKFIQATNDAVDKVKELMPEYDYDEFTRPVQTIEYDDDGNPIQDENDESTENTSVADELKDEDLSWD